MTHASNRIATSGRTGASRRPATRRQATLVTTLLAGSLLNAARSNSSQDSREDMSGRTPDGTVEIRQAQIAFIGSGASG
jgi:hypothetical protein